MDWPDDYLNKVIQGDCLEIMRGMPDKCVDLVVTDPPYDFTKSQIWDLLGEFQRVSRYGSIVFFPPENQWGIPEQYLFWVKPISTKNTSRRYSRFVEMIGLYNLPLKTKWDASRHWSQYTNVFTDLVEGESEHPYEKPRSLMRRLILNHSERNDLILDPFLGSGTTAVAAKQLGRNYIGIELSEKYCKIAEERLRQETLF
jgi:site-specific DNA-methyltransferase (adenine-specific)